MIDPVELRGRIAADRAASAIPGLDRALRSLGATPRTLDRHLVVERGHGSRGLVLAGRDLPHEGARARLASLAAAFFGADDPGEEGRLVFAVLAGGPSSEWDPLLAALGPLRGGILAEPTGMAICPVQRGRMSVQLVYAGDPTPHARGGRELNAIELAVVDLERLARLSRRIALIARGYEPAQLPELERVISIDFPAASYREGETREEDLLGAPEIAPALIEGGECADRTPDRCTVTLDVRTTPSFEGDEALAMIREHVRARVETIGAPRRAALTRFSSAIFRAARAAFPDSPVRALDPPGDLASFAHAPGRPIPSLAVGPGSEARELPGTDALRAAARGLTATASAFFALDDDTESPHPCELDGA